jgi:hypothetical protein
VIRRWLALTLAAAGACGACMGACLHEDKWPGPIGPPPAAQPPPPTPSVLASGNLTHAWGPHPRILLTADRLAAVSRQRAGSAPSWRRLAEQCEKASRETIEAGYEAWDWANATLDLAVCHRVTSRPEYAAATVKYFRAMLDDRRKVGDGAGGDDVVHHDDGYGIRTRGCFGAIAYDWIRDLPGMTPDVRTHAIDRFVAWTKWFSERGYSHDQPIANYYMGYFGAVAFGAIALDGDDPRAADLFRNTERMYEQEILPAYRRKLVGGDFPEGWQYGDMVGAVLAIFSDAESRPVAQRSLFDELPWLRESVAHRTHALWPDGVHTFDTGDWSHKPAVAPAHLLLSLATVLPEGDIAARRARALAHLAVDSGEEWHWLAALADDPLRGTQDPRRGPTSYLSGGTATMTARTDWSAQAVWVGMTSGPSLSDHQHLDAGHFEIVRGADPLIIDGGGYGAYSSLSHNVIAVDDKKENDTYAPNQGVWSDAARIARFEDSGRFVYALADYTSAYNPAGYPKDHPERSVLRAERELLFSRAPVDGVGESARVIVYDRVTVAKPTYGVTFLLHGGSAPEVQSNAARVAAGKSAAYVTTLLPGAAPQLVHEPTALGDGPYYVNDPAEGTSAVRIEVRSPRGEKDRGFLHALVVTATTARPPAPPARIEGEGVEGVAIDDEAYLFVRDAAQPGTPPLAYQAPLGAVRHVVMSLRPEGRYAVDLQRDGDRCRVTLRPFPSPPAVARAASTAGVLTLEASAGCTPSPAPTSPGPHERAR